MVRHVLRCFDLTLILHLGLQMGIGLEIYPGILRQRNISLTNVYNMNLRTGRKDLVRCFCMLHNTFSDDGML